MTCKEHFRVFQKSLRYIFKINRSYTVLLILHSFLSSAVVYIPIYFSAKVIDALAEKAPWQTAVGYAALTVGLVFAVQMVTTYVASKKDVAYYTVWRTEDWSYSEKAMQLAYESIEDPDVTRLRYRVRRESQTGQNLNHLYYFLGNFVSDLTKLVASVLLTVSFFALRSVPVYDKLALAAGVLAVLAVQVLATRKSNRESRAFSDSCVNMNILAEQFSEYIEHYGAGKDIRLYGMGDFLADSYMAEEKEFWDRAFKLECKKALLGIPTAVLNQFLKYGLYLVLIISAIQGDVSVASIAKYVSCMMLMTQSLTGIVGSVQIALANNQYLARYFSYFDIPNNMYKGTLTVEKRDDNEYEVEFKNVSFRYPKTDAYALKNVNLKFKIGEKLAIVGMNGSGKTTFIKLLCRLYDPTEGEILLNGVNIQKYDYDEYMSIFSVVFQDFTLFGFKLGEVVASSKSFDENKVRDCLNKANFGDRLAKMKDGVNTYLYKGYDSSGVEISGGEAQKIALARALYKDAPFVLLDEPTAALDPVSEYEVYSDFNSISGDKTTVYISHRLASCRFCDQIAVFDQGKIVQTGKHETLLADTNGKYRELWNAQAQYYQT